MFLACMLVLGGDFLISQVHHGFSRHTSGRECAKTLYHSSVSCQIFSERIWRGTVDQRMQKTLHICVVVVVVVKSSCPAVVVIMVWETICPWQVKEMTVTSNSN
mmetsp:Transcript_33209/g.54187  ORF Transcript_33209/g.54187 Transcript_33209/m.54187 type:complete len:104 (-) Transcript_33209:358-669(-)